MANIETQFLISKDIKNHVFFFKKFRTKSHKRQATGRWVGGPTGSKQVIHRLSTGYSQFELSTGYPQKKYLGVYLWDLV